ncbi:MAG TPA: pyrroline-5-carboxylate reductase [Nevskiales bacterium]|nr:pyrroline-5-carboxylate reductase [Nevskiales bacterium]
MPHSIGFIGGGNMAASLIGGLLADGLPREYLHVAEPDPERQQFLAARFGLRAEAGTTLAATADILVLAVKPQVIQAVARELAPALATHKPLVISIAAGIRTADLSRWLGGYTAIVRAMPNTPALIQAGATGLYAMPAITPAQRAAAESVLRAVGLTCWVDEERLIDGITALSGSGPAYFFLLMEALQEAGHRLGLDSETARLLTLQTAFGASKMALESSEPPGTLRARVTSPGGTTEQALKTFIEGRLPELVEQALKAAARRAEELAREFGKDRP